VNLSLIEKYFIDGDIVNIESLQKKGLIPKNQLGVKILAKGDITKKVTIEASSFSEAAKKKLEAQNITFKIL